jgi:phosphoglycolate phosphatase-like HAD superfamily hydrolase
MAGDGKGCAVVKAGIFEVDRVLVDRNDLHLASWAETFRRFGQAVAPSGSCSAHWVRDPCMNFLQRMRCQAAENSASD